MIFIIDLTILFGILVRTLIRFWSKLLVSTAACDKDLSKRLKVCQLNWLTCEIKLHTRSETSRCERTSGGSAVKSSSPEVLTGNNKRPVGLSKLFRYIGFE